MRHTSFVTVVRRAAHAVQRAERERERAAARVIRETERRQKAAARESERRLRADQKAYAASRLAEAEAATEEIRDREKAIAGLLERALLRNPRLDLDNRLMVFQPEKFNELPWKIAKPDHLAYLPQPPGFFRRFVPGARKRHEAKVAQGKELYRRALTEYRDTTKSGEKAFAAFSAEQNRKRLEIEQHNEAVRAIQGGLASGDHAGVVAYFGLVIEESLEDEIDALGAEVGYAPLSRHLVVDLELPDISVVPEETGYRYVKSGDRIEPQARSASKRKALYLNLISQAVLKCVDAVFRGWQGDAVESLTLNGMLDAISPATGQSERVCLISVRVTADSFSALNLRHVQPEDCLKSLKASVSRAPAELVAVKPFVELDMVDPRFIQTSDVMADLESRQNLMDLTPTAFEGLITNLFGTMGLDTRQTRASRDGGVDCVAFDSRPIFGGKVVIQAKRYKNTVGVSAVRDLFGTVQNEGASKGILVTTSGYGKAAYDFARGKPLELLDGGNLLHLLKEHAGIDARIEVPTGWVDAPLHGK